MRTCLLDRLSLAILVTALGGCQCIFNQSSSSSSSSSSGGSSSGTASSGAQSGSGGNSGGRSSSGASTQSSSRAASSGNASSSVSGATSITTSSGATSVGGSSTGATSAATSLAGSTSAAATSTAATSSSNMGSSAASGSGTASSNTGGSGSSASMMGNSSSARVNSGPVRLVVANATLDAAPFDFCIALATGGEPYQGPLMASVGASGLTPAQVSAAFGFEYDTNVTYLLRLVAAGAGNCDTPLNAAADPLLTYTLTGVFDTHLFFVSGSAAGSLQAYGIPVQQNVSVPGSGGFWYFNGLAGGDSSSVYSYTQALPTPTLWYANTLYGYPGTNVTLQVVTNYVPGDYFFEVRTAPTNAIAITTPALNLPANTIHLMLAVGTVGVTTPAYTLCEQPRAFATPQAPRTNCIP